MAPIAPKKRSSIRAKTAKATTASAGYGLIARPPVSHTAAASAFDDGFSSTKKDKRTIKHSAFVNRIEKGNKKALKRRRPSKKLVTTLEGLADALPDFEEGEEREVGQAKIKQTSMKSRPGATKRREKLEKMERERFGKNMAQLAAGSANVPVADIGEGAPEQSGTSSRWAALRGFISQTMEQKPEFVKKV